MKIMLVAGARPNFMKIAPIMKVLATRGIRSSLVHTGQHYDYAMSHAFFEDLEIPTPEHFLDVGSGTHAAQTARIMERFEPVFMSEKPDWLVVVGDVNSTLACALVACKLKPEIDCRIVHVEAGLRSRDWLMPEEVNRVLTDRLSDLLFTTSREAGDNLLREGIEDSRIVFAGNVMIDTVHSHLQQARNLPIAERYGLKPNAYAVVTLHRPSNVDDIDQLQILLRSFGRLTETMPVVFPIHPRTLKSIDQLGLSSLLESTITTDPLGYSEMLSLTLGARVVLTDSGGLQEETTALGIPCVTLREQTERPITITHGTNRLAPWPLSEAGIMHAVTKALETRPPTDPPEGWDGRASERIVDAICQRMPRTRELAYSS